VNQYLAVVAPVIEEHGGVVDKYIGDAVMGLFPGDAGPAVRAALHLLHELDQFNDEREAAGAPRLETGVGLHTGSLMLGTVGTGLRMDGTVVGEAVNLSSRIEGLTKIYGTRLLVSEATWQALDPLERPQGRLVDRVRVAGTTRPVGLYHILTQVDVEARYTEAAFTAGRDAYFAAEFDTAERHLLDVLRRHPEDRAAQLLVERCREFSRAGVPPGWDGVTTFDRK
jgi:two-component system sensor histidine kinase ChiS